MKDINKKDITKTQIDKNNERKKDRKKERTKERNNKRKK